MHLQVKKALVEILKFLLSLQKGKCCTIPVFLLKMKKTEYFSNVSYSSHLLRFFPPFLFWTENHFQKEEREKDLETFKILVTLQVR